MNNEIFRKTMENVREHRDVKLVRTERRRNFLSKPKSYYKFSYYKNFHRKFISSRNETAEILMNKPVYSGLSILALSKILMNEFWFDYVKRKYVGKAKLFHCIHKNRWCLQRYCRKCWNNIYTWNYELDRLKEKIKKLLN